MSINEAKSVRIKNQIRVDKNGFTELIEDSITFFPVAINTEKDQEGPKRTEKTEKDRKDTEKDRKDTEKDRKDTEYSVTWIITYFVFYVVLVADDHIFGLFNQTGINKC